MEICKQARLTKGCSLQTDIGTPLLRTNPHSSLKVEKSSWCLHGAFTLCVLVSLAQKDTLTATKKKNLEPQPSHKIVDQ